MMWHSLVNQFPLTKTLRFELKPQPVTAQHLEIITKDKTINQLYQTEMKPMFDAMHEKFISDALSRVKFEENTITLLADDIKNLFKLSKNREENKVVLRELANRIKENQQQLRKTILASFTALAQEWNYTYLQSTAKKPDWNILINEEALALLEALNPDKTEVINKFKGYFTYFIGLGENRKNYYTNDGHETEVVYRVININLSRYIKNFQLLSRLKHQVPELDEILAKHSLVKFNNYLNQSEIDKYNLQIVGVVNSKVNEYCQQNQVKLPKLNVLYKQIGSHREKHVALVVTKENEWSRLFELIQIQEPLLTKLKTEYIDNFEKIDWKLVYFNQRSINTISSKWFIGGWHQLGEILNAAKIINTSKTTNDYVVSKHTQFSLEDIEEGIRAKRLTIANELKQCVATKSNYKAHRHERLLDKWHCELSQAYDNWINQLTIIKQINQKNIDSKQKVQIIKSLCDSLLNIDQMLRYHQLADESVSTDTNLYTVLDEYWQNSQIVGYYNAFRNYFSQKPFSTDKFKLNFECSMLANGWDINKEPDYHSIILKTKNKYYLAISAKKSAYIFSQTYNQDLFVANNDDWQKMMYKLLPSPNKMLPKVCFAKKNVEGKNKIFDLSADITRIRQLETFKKGEKFNHDDLTAWITYLQDCIHKYPSWQEFNFKFKKPNEYNDVSEFYSDVAQQGYKLSYKSINFDIIDRLEKNEQLYLFEICNKDFNEKSTGKKNLHTLLFHAVMKPENVSRLKLNGGAQLFFREASIAATVDLRRSENKSHNITENRRYTTDKYFLHFPVEVRATTNNLKLNQTINKLIASNINDVTILGVDRGEKHLLYYSLIKSDGKIISQGSLNTIHNVDYHQKLAERVKDRNIARQSWQEIGQIKDLKSGYLSQVIHELVKMIVDNNAILVMEDLNTKFKAKRFAKVEKSLYQKFETALATKLAHLVDKQANSDTAGGILYPLQLAPKLEKISDFERAKQWGVMYYVRANYTSTTDPYTGWRKHLYLSNQASQLEVKKWIKDKNIIWKKSPEGDYYIFEYSYNGRLWRLHAHSALVRTYARKIDNQWQTYSYNMADQMNQVVAEIQRDNYQNFAFNWNLLNQIRNNDPNQKGNASDYIQSPVWSELHQGFFDSRSVNSNYPDNGDANGAYNIARKGAMLLKRIQINPERPDLYISDEQWDQVVNN